MNKRFVGVALICLLLTSCGQRETAASVPAVRTKNAASDAERPRLLAYEWTSYEKCGPLGAIYRSSPVIVPPPQEFDSTDENFDRTSRGFLGEYFDRPVLWQNGPRPLKVEAEASTDGVSWVPATMKWVAIGERAATVRLLRNHTRMRLVVTTSCRWRN